MITPAASERPIRVLLADDDRLVRIGIAAIIASPSDVEVAAEASDGTEALDLARRHDPDVVLLDIQMPGFDGIQSLEQLRREQPAMPVAMLTTFSDEAYMNEAIALGAMGFFLKSDDPEHLLAGVRALAGGGAAFSPRVGRWLIRQEVSTRFGRRARARELLRDLTPRQRELLTAVGSGLTNAQIAKSLHLSEGTVKQYLSSLFTALGTDNRVQAAILAYEAGLTELRVKRV